MAATTEADEKKQREMSTTPHTPAPAANAQESAGERAQRCLVSLENYTQKCITKKSGSQTNCKGAGADDGTVPDIPLEAALAELMEEEYPELVHSDSAKLTGMDVYVGLGSKLMLKDWPFVLTALSRQKR